MKQYYLRRWSDLLRRGGIIGLMSSPLIVMAESSAAETAEKVKIAATVQPSDYFLQILLSLILILLIIFFAAWFLKRYAHVNGAVNGQLKVLGGIALGQREKVVLLQIGEEQIVIGVTPSQITHLYTLTEPIKIEEGDVTANRFSARLQEALQASKSKRDKKRPSSNS